MPSKIKEPIDYDALAKERGLARRFLMTDNLGRGAYARYEIDENDEFYSIWVGYAHHGQPEEEHRIKIIHEKAATRLEILGFVK